MNSDNDDKEDYGSGDKDQDQVKVFENIWVYLERMMMTASSLLAENSSA